MGKKVVEVPAQQPPPPAPPPPAGTPPPPPPLPVPPVAVCALAYSPDGKVIAAGGADGQIHLFQAADGKFVRSLPGHTSAVTALTFPPARRPAGLGEQGPHRAAVEPGRRPGAQVAGGPRRLGPRRDVCRSTARASRRPAPTGRCACGTLTEPKK